MIHDRFDSFYKNPLGAVKTNEKVDFRICLPKRYEYFEIGMCLMHNITRKVDILILEKEGENEEGEVIYRGEYVPKEAGVYWYNFKVNYSEDSKEYIIPGYEDEVLVGAFLDQMLTMEEKYWRFTVYDEHFQTPSWLLGGIVYQIFPDRFCYSGVKKDQNYVGERRIHEWNEFPCWDSILSFMGSHMDFYQGDLKGITDKITYLEQLGVDCIYLNPIFESASSHRYNTGDYEKVDSMLGTNDDFIKLCKIAKEHGIRVINDGVFSHTGSDSKYFNLKSSYDSVGACNSKESKYYDWYTFYRWPNYYKNWWNYDTLPKLTLDVKSCMDYFLGEGGIVDRWYQYGNSGWRLDAIDDLPDDFLCDFRKKVKSQDKDNLIVGEIWHDASLTKFVGHDTYDSQFLLGGQIDTCTNYLFRNAILGYFQEQDAGFTIYQIMNVLDRYPKPIVDILFNSLSTHDTARILTVMITNEKIDDLYGYFEEFKPYTEEAYLLGLKRLKIATAIQYTLPGVPCVFYGDEVGAEGYIDPYNRVPFPWDHIQMDILDWHIALAKFRKGCKVLREGRLENLDSDGKILAYRRYDENGSLFCYFNISEEEKSIKRNKELSSYKLYFDGHCNSDGDFILPAMGMLIFEELG